MTISEIAGTLLEEHFPETYHNELLDKVGLNVGIRTYRKRDFAFRKKYLRLMKNAVQCVFKSKINDSLVGVEAAHIKWHQAYGPDTEENGLALCSLHHKLFDKGIFTVRADRMIEVSEKASRMGPYKELMTDFNQDYIRRPSLDLFLPDAGFTEWHVREVYKGY
ncbi:HNH endonuclease [Halobacillus salinus]|uniref:HNH nuclease domain-containing protein n=1 Tax=Halobacillus salinus TaxID=192814 RepID=A0A4Z0H054_9BACI|nr:HNH endonuclease [Halobacillus salinus]TGB03510.1 hypothetical protein E4663_00460 [Halobacillus salinus]